MIDEIVTLLIPDFGWGSMFIFQKAKLSKKVVAAQRLFEPKALHITTCIELQKLAESFG